MCLAAKTPSTMAQQKAAITPKLIKTIEATNCEENKTKSLLAFHSCCFWRIDDPQETARQSKTLPCHSMRMLFAAMGDWWELKKGEAEKGPMKHLLHFQGK